MHLRVFAIAFSMACGVGVVQAADMGSLTVLSRMQEPFYAKLEVTRASANESVKIQFAPDAVYQRAGVKRLFGAGDFSLELTGGQKAILWIRGKRAMATQNFSLIFEAKGEQKTTAKLYRVQLPPSIANEEKTGAAPQAPVEHREKAASSSPASQAGMEKKAAERANALQKKAFEQAKAAEKKARESAKKTVASKPSRVPVSQLKRVTLPLDPSQYNMKKPFLVQPGMTGWSIGRLYRTLYPKASVEQVLVALVHANPDEFEGGKATGAVLGSWLVAPSAAQVAAVDAQLARKAVHASPAVDLRAAVPLLVSQKAKKPAAAVGKTSTKEQPKPSVPQTTSKPAEKVASQPAPAAKVDSKKAAQKPAEKKPVSQPKPQALNPTPTATSQITPLAEESPKLVGSVRRHFDEPVGKKSETFLSTGSALFWALLSLFLAIVSGGLWWYVRKRVAEEDREEPVMFSQSRRSASEEQLKNIDKAVSQRLQSDLRSQQGMPKLDETFKLDSENGVSSMAASEPTITKSKSPELEMLEMVHEANEKARETGEGHVEPIRIRTDSISISESYRTTIEPKVESPMQAAVEGLGAGNRQEPHFEESVRSAADELSMNDGEFELLPENRQPGTPPKA